jgi:hypothetical protein
MGKIIGPVESQVQITDKNGNKQWAFTTDDIKKILLDYEEEVYNYPHAQGSVDAYILSVYE